MSRRTPVVLAVSSGDPLAGIDAHLGSSEPLVQLTMAPQGPVLEAIEERAVDLVVLDFESLGASARALLASIQERWNDLPLIVLRQVDGLDELAEVLGAGAADVVAPGLPPELALAIQKALVRLKWSAALPRPRTTSAI